MKESQPHTQKVNEFYNYIVVLNWTNCREEQKRTLKKSNYIESIKKYIYRRRWRKKLFKMGRVKEKRSWATFPIKGKLYCADCRRNKMDSQKTHVSLDLIIFFSHSSRKILNAHSGRNSTLCGLFLSAVRSSFFRGDRAVIFLKFRVPPSFQTRSPWPS